jgi:O-acetyl-ADP-ribose deacetylase (regulator of RNase III)
MANYREIPGNLITLALEGTFDVIAHGCNCFCTMGAGIAPQMARTFKCDTYSLEDDHYDKSNKGNFNKMGQIEFRDFLVSTMSGAHPVNYAGIVTHEFK